MDPVVTSASAQYVQSGLLGTALVVFSVVIVYLWKEARAALIARIDDQKAMREEQKAIQAQLLELVRLNTIALTNNTASVEGLREVTLELKGALKDFGEEMRGFGDDLRTVRGTRVRSG
jgi:hypothetical protein